MRWTLLLVWLFGAALGHSADLELSRLRLVALGADRILEFELRYPPRDGALFLTAVAGVNAVAQFERRGSDGAYRPLERLPIETGISGYGMATPARVRFVRPDFDTRAVLTLLFSDASSFTVEVGAPGQDWGWRWGAALWTGAVLLGMLAFKRRQKNRGKP